MLTQDGITEVSPGWPLQETDPTAELFYQSFQDWPALPSEILTEINCCGTYCFPEGALKRVMKI